MWDLCSFLLICGPVAVEELMLYNIQGQIIKGNAASSWSAWDVYSWSSVSMPGEAEENHMKWLWVLFESHSGDPRWQWALTSSAPIMSFVGKSSAKSSVPRRMEWSIVSFCPEILSWWLNLNFSSASLGMTPHSDNCSFIVVVVTQSSLTWVQDRIEGGEVKVEVDM